MERYKVICFFQSGRKRTVYENLSLEEAQKICRDPETSSRTATGKSAKARTKSSGAWFYGYKEM